jgi:hypothetical protein
VKPVHPRLHHGEAKWMAPALIRNSIVGVLHCS